MRSGHACQQIVLDKLSNRQKYRVNLLLFFLVLVPFINIFGHMDRVSPFFESFSLSKVFNYGAILGFGVALPLLRRQYKFSAKLLLTVAILLVMLGINYLLTPLASTKWLLNWLGFIFVSLMVAQIVKSYTDSEIQFLQAKSLILIKLFLIALTALVAFSWLTNISDLVMFVSLGMHNHIIAILSNTIGIEKQALGIFLVFLVILTFTCWSVLSQSTRFILIITFLVIGPAMIGIRTMWLSLFLCAAWVYFTKYRSRRVFAYASILSAISIFNFYSVELMRFIAEVYDRLPSLQFAWSAMTSNLFGLGNGGYHIFVEKNNAAIVAQFGSERMEVSGLFWIAPESDLVYFIASWGILSAVFYFFFGYMLLRGSRIFHRKIELLPIERVMLLMSGTMVFMGISQDNAGGLIWWVYMAAGYGVILRHRGPGQKGNKTTQSFQHRTSQRVLV